MTLTTRIAIDDSERWFIKKQAASCTYLSEIHGAIIRLIIAPWLRSMRATNYNNNGLFDLAATAGLETQSRI